MVNFLSEAISVASYSASEPDTDGDYLTFDASPFIPPTARSVYLICHGDCGGDTVTCSIWLRQDSSSRLILNPIELIPMQGAADTASNTCAVFCPLGPKQSFDYKVEVAVNPDWRIELVGWA